MYVKLKLFNRYNITDLCLFKHELSYTFLAKIILPPCILCVVFNLMNLKCRQQTYRVFGQGKCCPGRTVKHLWERIVGIHGFGRDLVALDCSLTTWNIGFDLA